MNIVITILSIVAGLTALVLIIALFTKRGYDTHREIIINAPRQKVFDYLKQIKNQDNFNMWVMMDPGMKKEFKELTELLDLFKHGTEIKNQVKANRKLKQLQKEKILKWKFVL